MVFLLLFKSHCCWQFSETDQGSGKQSRQALRKDLNPLCYQFERFHCLVFPISSSLSVLLPLQHSTHEERDVMGHIESGVHLCGDEQAKEGESWCFCYVFGKEMFDVD
jgi:hypothetical protein